MRDPDPQCEQCGGTGVVTVSYNDPSDYHGYGEYDTPCECTLDDDNGGGTEPVEPPSNPTSKGGGEAVVSPLKINNGVISCKSTT